MVATDGFQTDVSLHGEVDPDDVDYAVAKLGAAAKVAGRAVLRARLRLETEPDPARELPAIAKAAIDFADGHVVRAQAEAPTMHEAADRLEARMRARLNNTYDREKDHR
jgi:hypothetical protein